MEKWLAVLVIISVMLLDFIYVYDLSIGNNVFKMSWGFTTYIALIIFNAVAFIFSRALYKNHKY